MIHAHCHAPPLPAGLTSADAAEVLAGAAASRSLTSLDLSQNAVGDALPPWLLPLGQGLQQLQLQQGQPPLVGGAACRPHSS